MINASKKTFKITEDGVLNTKAIKAIFVEDDILKIEYLNTDGNLEATTFVSSRAIDVDDMEYFLSNIVSDYRGDNFNFDLLEGFGKTIYQQLSARINSKATGYGRLKSIIFGRFVIKQAFNLTQKVVLVKVAKSISKNSKRPTSIRSAVHGLMGA